MTRTLVALDVAVIASLLALSVAFAILASEAHASTLPASSAGPAQYGVAISSVRAFASSDGPARQ
jgi:hypothetical protein